MEYSTWFNEINQFFDSISIEHATEGQKFAVRSAVGRMVQQLSREPRVLKFLYVSISKLTWEELYNAAKR